MHNPKPGVRIGVQLLIGDVSISFYDISFLVQRLALPPANRTVFCNGSVAGKYNFGDLQLSVFGAVSLRERSRNC